MKEALLAGDKLEAHGQGLAQHIVGLEARLLGKQAELKLVRPPEHLLAPEGLEQQHALGKGPCH